MKIENLRYGFACNSSSTHSVVVYPRGTAPHDRDADLGEFGWSTFVAASEEAKKSWLKTLIYGRFSRFGDETAKRIAESFYPGDDIPFGYIDHQSVPLIPRAYGSREPSSAFFQDLAIYILRDGVVIHGGNDNSESDAPPESNVGWYGLLPEEASDDNWVCRKDGDWWILFDTTSGTKVTLSFKDEPRERKFADAPELVDLKITDFCPYACHFCYQGSTRKGEHAERAGEWVSALQSAEVFEVAIGGGEPTLHPSFSDILREFADKDIRVNFTTRNLDWLTANAELVNKSCGAFAFSVDSSADARRALDALREAGLESKLVFQYVMGVASDRVFRDLLVLG